MFISPQFKFVVEDIPIYIHADLVSQHSEPLDRTMNGGWAEKHAGFAVLEGVDKGTFLRFAQWAYNGYYTAASFGIGEKETNEPTPADVPPDAPPNIPDDDEIHVNWEMPSKKKSYKGKKRYSEPEPAAEFEFEPEFEPPPPRSTTSKCELETSFKELPIVFRRTSIDITPPRPNEHEQEDYSEVFLCHARMYVFAAQKMIQPLQALAKEELQATLARFTLYKQRTGDIIALLRYIYETDSNGEADVDELRTLMSQYIGFEMDTLIKDVEFKMLMSEDKDGALLGDFLKMVEKRL